MFHADRPVAQIVTLWPAAARVFAGHGIDFCCGGERSLAEACASAGVDVGEVVEELHALPADEGKVVRWDQAPLGELLDHILDSYHKPLREELPRLAGLLCKLRAVHGEAHGELLEEVWGYPAAVVTRTVDTHIAEVRRKLEDDPSAPRHILTVRKAGYRFEREPGAPQGRAATTSNSGGDK